MAGCMPCFIIPLLLFIFHRYLQPILLKFWNPWGADKQVKDVDKKEECKFSCECAWNNKTKTAEEKAVEEEIKTAPAIDDKVKGL